MSDNVIRISGFSKSEHLISIEANRMMAADIFRVFKANGIAGSV